MHGIDGRELERNHDQAMATEKNIPTGNRRATSGSVP
jgi:hypothetical protein